MKYDSKTAYSFDTTTKQYDPVYVKTHKDVVFTNEDETETLTNKLTGYDGNFNLIFNKTANFELTSDILWKIQSAGKEPVYSTPIIKTLSTGIKALIYCSWDWYIYCRNAETGDLIWRYATAAPCYGRCQAEDVNGDGKIEVFGASHDGYVYCLDESGNKLWSFANLYAREGTGTVSEAGSYYVSDSTKNWKPNSFMRGTTQGYNASVEIVTGTGAGQSIEISGVDPTTLWLFNDWTITPDTTSTYKIVPKYDSDINYQHCGTLSQENNIWYLYVTGFDGQCVKLNASTGALVWKFQTNENIEPFPYVVDINNDGALEVLISALDKHVYCLKSTDGSTVWTATFTEGNDAFLAVEDIDDDGALEVLVSNRDNRIYVLNGVNGTVKSYTRNTGGDVDCRPLVSSLLDKKFICGGDSGYIYGYDSQCECLWGYKANDVINTSMVIGTIGNNAILAQGDQSGALHLLTTDGKIIKAMYLRGGIEGTPYLEQFTDYFILYVTTVEGWTYAIKIY